MLLAILPFVGANKRSRAAGMLSHHRPTQGHLWSWDKHVSILFDGQAAPFAGTDNETKNGLGAHESHARATANPAASTHNNELNTHDK